MLDMIYIISTWMIFGLFLTPISCVQVTLLDTKKTESLDWISHSEQDENGRRGWREASYTNTDGDVYRVYTVCNVAVTSVDNWLRTPFVARGNANRLYVEIQFTTRKCTKYPDPGRLQQCKESFKLLYYEAESDFANAMMPTWDENTYTHVDVIAANKVTTDIHEALINTETRSIPVTRKGVYFSFYDQGACTTLISVRIYYIMCPTVAVKLAVFPDTTTGPNMTSIVQTEGTCVSHASIEQPPSHLCKGDGHWYFPTGRCRCDPGYQPDELNAYCTGCPKQTFKTMKGNEACLACPAFSEARDIASVECRCVKGYYRGPSDRDTLPCSRPPSEPENLEVTFMDQSSVKLSWQLPQDLGGRSDIRYRIECLECPDGTVYSPQQKDFNSTDAVISNMNPNVLYEIRVFAENDVTRISDQQSFAAVSVTTDTAVPGRIRSLRVTNIGAHFVTLSWNVPYNMLAAVPVEYEVVYYTMDEERNRSTSLFTHQQNITLHNLDHQTKYSFVVRARSEGTWGDYSEVISATTGLISHHPSDSPIGIIAGSAVAVVLCMLIVITMVIIFLRRNQRTCREKNSGDCDALHYGNVVQCPHLLDGTQALPGSMTLPLFSPPGGVRTYVDPYTYEDPSQAIGEFTREIDASTITIESVIGGGEFGDVCKGRLSYPGNRDLAVAIKTLKAGASDKNRLDFLTEASIMGQFDDPNVIYLEGVVTRSNPIMIVTEFMENGSLDIFLRNNDGKFTIIQLIGMLRGIASGMRYLSEMGYVHRDLAARNILVSETLVCKVADFGLSREIENDQTDGEYTTKGGKIPVRWTAPEAIAYRKFTSASDVWSYGVVTWEVISYGERPYWNWSNQDVIKAIDRNFKLPPPMDCPEAVYRLMLECWEKDRALRPKFSVIVKTLDKLIRAPELLRDISLPGPNPMLYLSTPDVSLLDTVEHWLINIKMDRYTQSFLQAGYTTMEHVAQMTLKDLTGIGITLVGHQKKILNSIQALHARIHGAHSSDGYFV